MTVLRLALLDKHDTDTIHNFMEAVFQKFGTPDYMVGDGETRLIGAMRKYYSDILYQYCQRHFLDNLGKVLMKVVGSDSIKIQVAPIDNSGSTTVIIHCILYSDCNIFKSASKETFKRIMVFLRDLIGSLIY